MAIAIDGRHIADLAGPTPTEQAAAAIRDLGAWTQVARELTSLGSSHLQLAMHAVRAAVVDVPRVSSVDEMPILLWFATILDEALRRPYADLNNHPAAVALWHTLLGEAAERPRYLPLICCPSLATMPPPGSPCLFDTLRPAALDFVRAVIASSTAAELDELRALTVASPEQLEKYSPRLMMDPTIGRFDSTDSINLGSIMSMLWQPRNQASDVCDMLGTEAMLLGAMVTTCLVQPVRRLGSIAWLSRVGLAGQGPFR